MTSDTRAPKRKSIVNILVEIKAHKRLTLIAVHAIYVFTHVSKRKREKKMKEECKNLFGNCLSGHVEHDL